MSEKSYRQMGWYTINQTQPLKQLMTYFFAFSPESSDMQIFDLQIIILE